MQVEQHLWKILETAKTSHAKKTAVIDGDRVFQYDQIYQRSLNFAAWLNQRGIVAGDRVAICASNCIAYYESYFAVAACNAILVSINYRLNAHKITSILQDSGSKLLIADPEFKALINEILNELPLPVVYTQDTDSADALYEKIVSNNTDFVPAPEESTQTAQLYYTSGTTGQPKGVMLSHANVFIHAKTAVEEFELTDNDVWLHAAPMFHLADAWAVFAMTMVGAIHVMLPKFSSETALTILQSRKITITNLVPTMLNMMLKDEGVATHDYSSLRVILSGGASISPKLVDDIQKIFHCTYYQTYGLTETSPFLTISKLPEDLLNLPQEEKLHLIAKTGRPYACVQLRVADKNNQAIKADDKAVGEIQAKAKRQLDEASKEAFTEDGWFKTGDLATLDQYGFLNIVDRLKDIIISGGENVYTTEVEARLFEHPDILETSIFGLPDEKWGEIVCAAIVLKESAGGKQASAEDFMAFCQETLAKYKVPRKIFFTDSIPKTGSGKILKRELRDKFNDGES